MIKFQDIKVGDFLMANNEGDIQQGEVTSINNNDKQICIHNGTQEFWYQVNQLSSIVLDESQLVRLKFSKQKNEDGTVKYSKGAFRMLLHSEGDFSKFEIWYRDEKRHISGPVYVHQLQNHFYEMTKVYLNEESFH